MKLWHMLIFQPTNVTKLFQLQVIVKIDNIIERINQYMNRNIMNLSVLKIHVFKQQILIIQYLYPSYLITLSQQTLTMGFQFDILKVALIAGIAILTSSISELLSWFLLYRKEDYKHNKSEIERMNKKVDKLKNTHVIQAQAKPHEKKLAQAEASLKSLNQQMTFQSMKSNLLIGVLMIGAINMIGTYFQGQVIAMLPFQPFSLVRGITHRNIEGEDFTQSAYLPFYIFIAMIWRSNLKKALGFEQPKSAMSFFEPPKYKPE